MLAVFPDALSPSHERKCTQQPFCDCARADFTAAWKQESRLWLALSVCGAVLLIMAFGCAMKP
jgi:hypothetical protein